MNSCRTVEFSIQANTAFNKKKYNAKACAWKDGEVPNTNFTLFEAKKLY